MLGKWVIPPINRAMQARQDAIRDEFAELDEAKAKAEAAENEYREQLVEARHEAAKIREQAREEGALIIAEMREQAQAESERILSWHTSRSRPSVDRSWRSCAPRSARWRPHWPVGSSVSRSRTTSVVTARSSASSATSRAVSRPASREPADGIRIGTVGG